jgi:hypothetical protein
MKIIARAVKILFLIALLALAGCAKQGLSVSEYRDMVIQTLSKDQSPAGASSTEGSGFAAMISLLISDMGCMGQACTNELRFTHLRDLAFQDGLQVANYRGQLCDEKLRPPQQESNTHQEICNELGQIIRELGTIRMTSITALQLLGDSSTSTTQPAVQLALDGAAANLSRSQQKIEAAIASLQKIPWLKPALPSLP